MSAILCNKTRRNICAVSGKGRKELKQMVIQWSGRCARGLLLMLCLLAAPVWGALPDPVGFGYAVERGDLVTVKRWLDEGLDPEYQAAQVGTGLMVAAWNGNVEMMALFVDRGANPRRSNRNGEQALQLAAWNGHVNAVKWLLEHGGALNREGNNWGALHYAVFNGHDKLARELIARGAEVNARSPNGSTPLMLAAREGREELTKVLLESGADPKSKNDWGDNALALAMRYDHYRLGKMISTPEEFAIAVKAPKEHFGEASRSVAAPSEIEEILRQLRVAEAEGKPTEALRKQLMTAVEAVRRSSTPSPQSARRPAPLPYQPKSIVITARRGQAGAERAEVMVDGKRQPAPNASTSGKPIIQVTPVKAAGVVASPAQIAELLRQIRLAEAQGAPSGDLKQQLYDAVESLKP